MMVGAEIRAMFSDNLGHGCLYACQQLKLGAKCVCPAKVVLMGKVNNWRDSVSRGWKTSTTQCSILLSSANLWWARTKNGHASREPSKQPRQTVP
jgi:hypothetical protein